MRSSTSAEAARFEHVAIAEEFVSARHPSIEGVDAQEGKYNFLEQNKWHRGAKGFSGVVYRNLWNGIDFKVSGSPEGVEQEFIVTAGANLHDIQVAYRGADRLDVDAEGSLVIRTPYGNIREQNLFVYQSINGKLVRVNGRFKLTGTSTYTFEVGPYDANYELVIDPTLLYSTFLGGSAGYSCSPFDTGGCTSNEYATGIGVDSKGNAYVSGFTQSTDFPLTVGAFQTTNDGYVAFVTKLNALGSELIYSTFLGHYQTTPTGLSVASTGEAFVTGYTASTIFPTTANRYAACVPAYNGFLSVLNATGDQLLYSTCFGSGVAAQAVAVDTNMRAYITGHAGSIPVTPGAYQTTLHGSGTNAFLTVFDTRLSGGASLVYSTYFGGTGNDNGQAISVGQFGIVFLTGQTSSSDFPTTSGAFQRLFSFSNESFVAAIDTTLSGTASLKYSTYLGPPPTSTERGNVIATAIAVDATGSAYVVGDTASPDFPVTPGAFQTVFNMENYNAFVTKLTPDGNDLAYSTLLAGASGGNSAATSIRVDSEGIAYLTGFITSGGTGRTPTFPVTPDAFQTTPPGAGDAFVTKLNAAGSGLIYSTYLGGSSGDGGVGIAIDNIGDAYVVGNTASLNFPVTSSAAQPSLHPLPPGATRSQAVDLFITKLPLGTPSNLSIVGITPQVGGTNGSVTITITGTSFLPGATTQLVCGGQAPITPASVSVSQDGRIITATFSLGGVMPGHCSVVVQNSNGPAVTDTDAFTVQSGGAPSMWIDIVGLPAQRGGTSQQYFVVYGNAGSIDSRGNLTLSIQVPKTVGWPLGSSMPLYGIDTSDTQLGESVIRGFFLPAVPPQGTGVFPITISVRPLSTDTGFPFKLQAWIDPF
jgi:hypothetical protein